MTRDDPPRRPPPAEPTGLDAVIEAYRAGIDESLLRENLALTHTERVLRFQAHHDSLAALRGLARRRE